MQRRHWLGGALALSLSACASWEPPMRRALRGQCATQCPPGVAPRARLAGVPFFAQGDHLCGPAVLASLLAWSGAPVPLDTLTDEVYLPGRQGSLQAEMLAAPRRHGRLSLELPAQLDALLQTVSEGTPVGVLLNLSLPLWPRWHYAVLLGHDLAQDTVLLHSGDQAASHWSLSTFEHTWARSGHWAMTVQSPGSWPGAADEVSVIRSLNGWEQVHPEASDRVMAWQSAVQRWPQRLSLSVGLAQAQQDAGRANDAVLTLERATQQGHLVPAWNNLALAYARAGRTQDAKLAADRAVALAEAQASPWLAEARRTRDELSR